MSKTKSGPMDFEDSMKQLEEISNKLSAGNLKLEEMIELYEKGMKLAGECRKQLNMYEGRIEKIDKALESPQDESV